MDCCFSYSVQAYVNVQLYHHYACINSDVILWEEMLTIPLLSSWEFKLSHKQVFVHWYEQLVSQRG